MPGEFLKKNFWTIAAFLGGILIVSSGAYLSYQTDENLLALLLTIVGSVMSSIAGSLFSAKTQVREQIQSEINIVRTELLSTSAYIGNCLDDARMQTESPGITFAKLEQSILSLQNVTRQLGVLAGEGELESDKDKFLEARRNIADIQEIISAARSQPQPIFSENAQDELLDQVQNKIDHFVRTIESLPAPHLHRVKKNEKIQCPYCRSNQIAAIGSLPGDTAHHRCNQCSTLFNVHRNSRGVIFTRPPNKESAILSNEIFQCKNCEEANSISISHDIGSYKVAECKVCNSQNLAIVQPEGIESYLLSPEQVDEIHGVKKLERIYCGKCGSELDVDLGIIPGSTSQKICDTCKSRNLIHRTSDCSVTQRHMEFTSSNCPNPSCNFTINAKIDDQSDFADRFCFACGFKVRLIFANNECEILSTKPKQYGNFIDNTTITCPGCQNHVKTIARVQNELISVCNECDVVVSCEIPDGSF